MLLEILQEYYKITWQDFVNEMADQWSYSFHDKCKKQEEDLEEQIYEFARKPDAFHEFSKCIEEMDPDIFSNMIMNLDSSPEKYDTLYDIFEEFNNIHKSKVIIPSRALKIIKIEK